jgi:protein SCO1
MLHSIYSNLFQTLNASRLQHRLRLFFAALCLTTLAACADKPSFRNTDITGAEFAREFALTDHDGKARTLADFKDKAVVVFFGFTQCPDVCPTTLAEMTEVLKLLGADSKRVQVLFVTIDPERDTPELLRKYVPAFHPSFLGLTGSNEAIAKVAKEFKVFYQKSAGKTPGSYTMDHTANSYVFDPQGRVRLVVKHGLGAEPLVQDLKQLLK